MQGPTISPVFTPTNGGGAAAEHGFYAVTICVPKKKLYASVKALRKVRPSGITMSLPSLHCKPNAKQPTDHGLFALNPRRTQCELLRRTIAAIPS